jgi:hypothetical protein
MFATYFKAKKPIGRIRGKGKDIWLTWRVDS